MNPAVTRFAALMGSASLLTLATAVHAQQTPPAQTAQAAPGMVPEQVLVTGSLIHGAAAVGVPVTNLGVQDFTETGNVLIGDLFRTVPEANVAPGPSAVNSGGHQERETRVNIRGLDGTGPRSLLMIDGVRFPPQADGLCAIDPSVIPALALDRVDILADGASATYGSDAIAGVINVVLKRGFDGATTLLHFQAPDTGGQEYQASQLWGRTWDGGDITLTYEFLNEAPIKHDHSNFTMNYSPWGLDNEIPIGSSSPGVVSTGKPAVNNGVGVNGVGTNCSNCFSIPRGTGANFNPALNNGLGPLTAGSASTISWAQLMTRTGDQNEIDPLQQGWELAGQQRNSFVATFDQRLFPGVSFFFTGFYSNRRGTELTPSYYSTGSTNGIRTFAVPTTNPYYPSGAPAGLQVSYDLNAELPPTESFYELSQRYQFGLNVDLPFSWTGQIYDSRSYETDKYLAFAVNDNAASIALGATVGGVTKPASVPYLNLFCDPHAFQCNSPTTLAYLESERWNQSTWQIEEKAARFDGPLFSIPAGDVKAAIGGTYESDNVLGQRYNNESLTPASTPPGVSLYGPVPADLNIVSASVDPEPYTVWAGFAQVDIPVFGDNFNLPLVRKLDLEASWRHDQYNSPNGALKGGTSNPKLAFTWLVDELSGMTIRGSWGTSFRFANAGEYSTVVSDSNTAFGFGGFTGVAITCGTSGQATPGSFAAALVAAGYACGSTPAGISWAGGPHTALRNYVNAATGLPATREGGTALPPETSENYSAGVEFAPTLDFLRGLDVSATWYSVKINDPLAGGGSVNTSVLADPTQRFRFILPSDLGCPVSANANPVTCAPFEAMVTAALTDVSAPVPVSQVTNVQWLEDGSTFGSGFLHVSGIDWNASYDIDLGDLGAWNTGITGTYYLQRLTQSVTGGPVIDALHGPLQSVGGIAQNGVETAPRLVYRARLGWSDGPYNIAGFMNYQSHYFSPVEGAPPNVNFQCVAAGSSVGGGTFPCAISNFTNYEPDFITFDLSFGYNTGDIPANTYLKNITLQLTIQNLLNRHSPFDYIPTTAGGRQVTAYDLTRPNDGRVIGVTLMKNW
ncbi:MAG: TonB-dependent receptor [Alphaproteobacteria bacterium]|nr:TonB-dependent receptor [Alphaproteobacteria bacterium]